MSLLSTFYFGDATAIAEALRLGNFGGLKSDAPVPACDFSGGIRKPFLMPEDFDALFALGAEEDKRLPESFTGSFAKCLSDESNEDTGTYLLRPDVCAAFAALPASVFQSFTDEWHRKHESYLRGKRGGCLRTAALWKILGGITLGLGAFAAVEETAVPLYYLAGIWLLLMGFAVFVDRPWRPRPQAQPVDWQPRLLELQQRFAAAVEGKYDTVYFWSL